MLGTLEERRLKKVKGDWLFQEGLWWVWLPLTLSKSSCVRPLRVAAGITETGREGCHQSLPLADSSDF